jgi:predicted acylesterase/phospholipase RssA
MRVLSVDGGGVRGVVPSAVLAYWENELKFESPDRFDRFAGTSTGAMVAAALALGLSGRRILMLFQDHAGEIFTHEGKKFAERALSFKGWAIPAYSQDVMRDILTTAFGDATMGDCPKPLSVPATDVMSGAPKVFRSSSAEDAKVRVVDVVIASTAAPTFFPSVQVAGSTYVDGALWANNPTMIAMLDARDGLGHSSFDELAVVSLGCGRPYWGRPSGFGERRGLLGWGAPLISLMMANQAQGVHDYAARLLSADRYLRVDPLIRASLAGLDEVDNIPDLLIAAAEEAREKMEAFGALYK